MYTDIILEQKAENFMRHLGLTPKGNYFSCYEYAHPFSSITSSPNSKDNRH